MNRLSRRRFLTTGVTAAVAASFARSVRADLGATQLRATRRVIDVDGKAADVFGLVQPDGRHGVVADAGKRFHVRLVNELDEHTLVHWHGLTPPSEQDGVPGLSQPALQPGGTYDYDFPLARHGTYWMHSHVGLQEQQLLAAPLVIRDPAEVGRDEQEVVVLLHDFSFRGPAEIYAELTGAMAPMDHGSMSGMESMDMGGGMEGMNTAAGTDHAAMGHGGGMAPHLNDVEFDAYLANDRTLHDPEVVRIENGGRVRLRIINAAATSNLWLDLGPLTGALIAVDGHAVVPVSGSRFPLAIAQRADIRLQLPPGEGAYPILAIREGDTPRTGIVLATKGAAITRVPDRAGAPAAPLDLGLETSLMAMAPLATRVADRTHLVELGGGMMPFVWTMNGARFGEHTPLPVRAGERVEIVIYNRTDMSHPMHLHGHVFQVIAIDDRPLNGALRDTVLVPANGRVTIAFDADNPGHWAFHCHNLYHMAAGMMTSVRYEG